MTENAIAREIDNTWAVANGQPQALATGDAGNQLLTNVNIMVTAQKTAAGVLPANFFNVPFPANFYGKAATAYDITTLQGYKLYQLRTAYSTSFATCTTATRRATSSSA
jgi:hypothetical protein